jgi:hypothetical protein
MTFQQVRARSKVIELDIPLIHYEDHLFLGLGNRIGVWDGRQKHHSSLALAFLWIYNMVWRHFGIVSAQPRLVR